MVPTNFVAVELRICAEFQQESPTKYFIVDILGNRKQKDLFSVAGNAYVIPDIKDLPWRI